MEGANLEGAWDDWCDRLRALGRSVLAAPAAVDDQGRAEGVRYLARLSARSLVQALDFADPHSPRLFRGNDDVWQWGGPNVDNVYLGARIEGSGTYRLRGDVGSQPCAILQVLGTPAADDPIAVRVDLDLVALAGPDGRVDLVLGPGDDADVVLPADARQLVLREYVPSLDVPRAGFTIERLDEAIAPAPLGSDDVTRALDAAARWLEQNVPFWQGFTERRRSEVGDNRIERPGSGGPMGSDGILYSAGFFALAPGECLVVTVDEPVAPYWALQLYSLGWYEGIEPSRRLSSVNHTQAHVDADGRVRFVIALDDPGTPNWLDPGGHRAGMMHFRAVGCTSEPDAMAAVVALADLRASLPADHPVVGTAERAEAIALRRRLGQHRFVH